MKSQADIIGIVVIVVLLIFGMLIMYKPQSPAIEVTQDEQLQAVLIGALSQETPCGPLEMVVRDCYLKEHICSLYDSCALAKRSISAYFDEYYGSYEFQAVVGDEQIFGEGKCFGEKRAVSAILPADGEILVVLLMFCED